MWESRTLFQRVPCESQLVRSQERSRLSDSWSGPDLEKNSLGLLNQRHSVLMMMIAKKYPSLE